MCPDISEETPCDSFLISDHLTSATTKSVYNLVAYGSFKLYYYYYYYYYYYAICNPWLAYLVSKAQGPKN